MSWSRSIADHQVVRAARPGRRRPWSARHVANADALESRRKSNQAVVPNGGIAFGGSGEDRTVTIQAGASGTAVVTLTVTDAALFASSVRLTVFVGTNGPNLLTGSAGPDLFFGLTGADTIDGTGGVDFLLGGRGDDALSGGDDADTLLGGQGDDTLSGGNGDDDLRGEQGGDTLTGGAGGDLFSGGPGPDSTTDFDATEGDADDGSIP
jgi:Ca2+-binding RTX toxin-like protein